MDMWAYRKSRVKIFLIAFSAHLIFYNDITLGRRVYDI